MKANYGEVWAAVAAEVPDRLALVEAGGRGYTYRQFDDAAARLASMLESLGVRSGDKVAVLMYNRAEWMLSLFALFKLGATIVPINYRYQAREIDPLIVDSDAVAVIYPSSMAGVVAALETVRTGRLSLVQVADDDSRSLLAGARAFGELERFAPLLPRLVPEDASLFLYTGGTTGRPKGVVWGVGDMFDIQMHSTFAALGRPVPQSVGDILGAVHDADLPKPVTLPLSPFLHGTAITTSMNTLVVGGTLVVIPSPSLDPYRAMDALDQYGVTRLIVAGDAVAMRLLAAAGERDQVRLPRLSSVMSSGMRLSDETKARFHRLGDVLIVDMLAASEGGPFAIAMSRSAADLPAALKLQPGAVVFDEDLTQVQHRPGAVGMLGYAGSMPEGYYKAPERTAATYRVIGGTRYVVPGDYVRVLDGNGSIELLGRGSSVINTGGEKIYPSEIEEALLQHPLVTDVVVFGTPDPAWGEVVTAAVAVTDPAAVTAAEVTAFVGQTLAGFKKPRCVLVRPTLDRSPSGKANIPALRAAARREWDDLKERKETR
jgi:3-oxocholest-4-en-26-oate---CoA ligase